MCNRKAKLSITFMLCLSALLVLSSCSLGTAKLVTPAGPPTPIPTSPTPTSDPGAATKAAISELANYLGFAPDQITLLQVEPANWKDSCLGVEEPDQSCSPGQVEGFIVTLEAMQSKYVYHSSLSGDHLVLAERPEPPQVDPEIIWRHENEGSCLTATFTLSAMQAGKCDTEPEEYPAEYAADLVNFSSLFAPFETDTPAGIVKFIGKGEVTATIWQQRMIAEWAKLVYLQKSDGESNPGLILQWRLEGGKPEICNLVDIYASGMAYGFSCTSDPQQFLGRAQLTSSQLKNLYTWIDFLQSYEMDVTDMGAETTRKIIQFSGMGELNASEGDQRAMNELAVSLFEQVNTEQDPSSLEAAQQTLTAFFSALNEGDYQKVANLFIGEIKVLKDLNPAISVEDQPSLFEAACQVNGFRCDLHILHLVSTDQIATDRFRIIVELATQDGQLFKQQVYEASESITQFEFIVLKNENGFFCATLPVYEP